MSDPRRPRLRPYHDLEQFQSLLEGDSDFYLARKMGLNEIKYERRCADSEAREFARRVASALETGDYTGVSYQYHRRSDAPLRLDGYAKLIDGEGWFLKVGIVDDGPWIGSCHLTFERAETVGGNLVPRSHP